MPNLVDSLIRHCRADPTLLGVFGPASINSAIREDWDAGATPPLLAIEETATPARLAQCAVTKSIQFIAKVAPAQRSQLKTIQDALAANFQDKYGGNIATGNDAIWIIASGLTATQQGPGKDDAAGAWILIEQYEFTLAA